MRKKAISPLVSTVVLIVFAAALGAVVISWGNTEAFVPEEKCEKADLSVIELNNIPQVCYKDGEISFTAENKGEVDLVGFGVVVLGEEDIAKADVERGILIGDVVRETVQINDVGDIQKVILTPKIVPEKLCPKQGFDAENIGECK